MSSAHQDDAVQHFVLGFLRSCGARVDGNSVSLPTALARSLQVSEQLELCFSPSPSGTAEYITFGHPLLDRMLALSSGRGTAASLLSSRAFEPDFLHLVLRDDPFLSVRTGNKEFDRLRRALHRVSFPNSRPHLVKRSLSYQLQLLFGFRVSFVSDEKCEQLVSILMDPITESADALIDIGETISFVPAKDVRSSGYDIPTDGAPVPLEVMLSQASEMLPAHAYTTLRLYRKACQVLEDRLRSDLEKFSADAEVRLRKDLERIDAYYGGLAQEALDPLRKVFRQMAASSVRVQLAHSYDSEHRYAKQLHQMKQRAQAMEADYEEEVGELEKERARRQSELIAKYQTRAEVRLISLAALWVPRVEFSLRLAGPVRREVSFVYDVLRQRLVDHMCDMCEQALDVAYLCGCGELVCVGCFHTCADCAKGMCAACVADRCHICNAPLCPDCGSSCPWQGRAPGSLAVCARCRDELCPICLHLVCGIASW